ncbi:MAG: branched-chain amino acid ABC transporter permease, partial [Comamonadaceae bacterium]
IYHMQLNAALGPNLRFFGLTLDTSSAASWFGAAVLLLVGLAATEFMRRRFVAAWGSAQEHIEAQIKRGEAA